MKILVIGGTRYFVYLLEKTMIQIKSLWIWQGMILFRGMKL